jgi:hypothetical protein
VCIGLLVLHDSRAEVSRLADVDTVGTVIRDQHVDAWNTPLGLGEPAYVPPSDVGNSDGVFGEIGNDRRGTGRRHLNVDGDDRIHTRHLAARIRVRTIRLWTRAVSHGRYRGGSLRPEVTPATRWLDHSVGRLGRPQANADGEDAHFHIYLTHCASSWRSWSRRTTTSAWRLQRQSSPGLMSRSSDLPPYNRTPDRR